MAILRFILVAVVAAVVGALACSGVMKLMSDEFRPELAGAIGGAAGAVAVIVSGATKKKPNE